jgi:hypothetical protein
MFTVRFSHEAKEDIILLYGFLLENDHNAAEEAINAIENGVSFLREFPFSCRKAEVQNPFLRELLIPFGDSGCGALFEIETAVRSPFLLCATIGKTITFSNTSARHAIVLLSNRVLLTNNLFHTGMLHSYCLYGSTPLTSLSRLKYCA